MIGYPVAYPIRTRSGLRSHFKNRILVQGCGGAAFLTGGILEYFEDLKRGTNKDIGPKDFFEIASIKLIGAVHRTMVDFRAVTITF